ncbi:MAG: hypothetical protein AB1641_27485 [Thermodesulfobacteriota bacterium]
MNGHSRRRGLILAALVSFSVLGSAFLHHQTAWGKSLFVLNVESPGKGVYTQGFSSAGDLSSNLKIDVITAHLGPTFNRDADPVNITLNYRGLPIYGSFPTGANASHLTLTIPAIGVQQTFAGSSRGQSLEMLEDWFKREGGNALSKLQQYLVEHTSTDPIAGNPSSMMGQMVRSHYDTSVTGQTTRIEPVAEAEQKIKNSNLLSLGITYGNIRASGFDGSYYSLPLSYTIRWSEDSRKGFTIKLPISMVEIEGAKSYHVGLGAFLSWPINPRWVITPGVLYGFMGSPDMGSAAQMASASISSVYTWDLGRDWQLSLGNMIGYLRTLEFEYGGYKFDPKIENTVFRNGLMLSVPTDKMLADSLVEIFFVDTRYIGSALRERSYEEVGLAFGYRKFQSEKLPDVIVRTVRNLRLGVSYIWGVHTSVIEANFGFTF